MTTPGDLRAGRTHRAVWSARQQLALIVLCVLAGAGMTVRFLHRPVFLGEEIPINEKNVALAFDRINPNTASAASLDRLPGVGPAKVAAILEYRRANAPAAFATADDLANVRGIGKVTADRLAPYLTLPRRGSSE